MAEKSDHGNLFSGALELMIPADPQPEVNSMHGYALAQRIKAVSLDLLQIE